MNHIEWIKSQYPDLKLLGLIFLTDAGNISEKANASEKMHFGTQEQLRKLWEDFLATIDRIKTKSALEKHIEANKIGELPEWSSDGIYKRLITKSCI